MRLLRFTRRVFEYLVISQHVSFTNKLCVPHNFPIVAALFIHISQLKPMDEKKNARE